MSTKELLQIDNMLMIGATGRNSGKTTLAISIINKYKTKLPIIAFKLITVRDHSDICPRGGKGCGICHGLKANYDIKEETGEGTKDTMLLKKAGADHVYLIRAIKDNIKDALEEALKLVPEDAVVLCESNSARLVAKPACFVMINSNQTGNVKPTAKAVMDLADIVLESDIDVFEDFSSRVLPSYLNVLK